MKHTFLYSALTVGLLVIAGSAQAACTAEYKAKQDNPLKLDYGTVTVSGPCTVAAARSKVAAQLSARGWTLLKVISVSEN